MTRRRILVAAVPPPEVAGSVRTMRRMFGDHRPERIVPHMTLIPPFNVLDDAFDAYRRHVRSVVVASEPFEVGGRRFGTFLPDTPTIHLEIEDGGSGDLASLRESLGLDGVTRPVTRPFRPHVTVRSGAPHAQIDAVLAATSVENHLVSERVDSGSVPVDDTVIGWLVESVQIMEQVHRQGVGTVWEPVAEERFGPQVVVGRGGVETVIRSGSVIERAIADLGLPDGAAATPEGFEDFARRTAGSVDGTGGVPLCVTAEMPGSVGRPVGFALGIIAGELATLDALIVSPDHRGVGIGRRLLDHWCHRAAGRGAVLVRGAPDRFLVGSGFARTGGEALRVLVSR